MTNAFKTVLRNPGAVAPSGNPTYNTDTVDRAVYALGTSSPASPSHVLAYIRAKKWPTGTGFGSGLVDRLGNPVSSGAYAADAAKNASDANFGGLPSVDLTPLNGVGGGNNSPFEIAGGLRLNQSLSEMPSSFTVAAAVRQVASGPSVQNLFGTSDGIWSYFNASGGFNFTSNNNGSGSTLSQSGMLTPGTAAVIWYSWDNAAVTFRCGRGSTSILGCSTITVGYSPSSGDKVHPFGYTSINTGQCFYGQFEGFLLLDKAYMNGSVPADDALFTTLISTWVGLI